MHCQVESISADKSHMLNVKRKASIKGISKKCLASYSNKEILKSLWHCSVLTVLYLLVENKAYAILKTFEFCLLRGVSFFCFALFCFKKS